jgi:hypothetical protein
MGRRANKNLNSVGGRFERNFNFIGGRSVILNKNNCMGCG